MRTHLLKKHPTKYDETDRGYMTAWVGVNVCRLLHE